MAVALITGANRGIGLALVKAYAGQRDKVFATVRRTSDRAELDALAAAQPKWVEVIEMDVSDPAEIGRARRKLEAEPLDVLINNAGIGGPDRQSATDMDYDGLAEALLVNSIAPLRIANAFLPNVKAAKGLPDFNALQPVPLIFDDLGDGRKTVELLREANLL